MNPDASSRGLHPSIVLSAYLEPLVRGRRVAILGDATIGLADELSQRGARLLHVYDPDAARVAEALARAVPGRPHQVAHAVLAPDLGVRDGAFDVVIVPDLSLFDDPADAIRRARRLVPASGVAVFVSPNAATAGRVGGHPRAQLRRLLPIAERVVAASAEPRAGALGYYELFDLVSLQFAKVRMIGQAPFVGYTVADFAPDGEPEVSVDTSLLASSEEPEHFLAVASDRPVALDAYAVIEIPWQDAADAHAPPSTLPSERAALAEAEARAAALGSEIGRLRAAAEERAGDAAALGARAAELEAELGRRDARLKDIEVRAGDNHVRAERFAGQIRDLEEELVRQRDRGTKLTKLLDDEKKGRTKAEVELGMLRGRPEIVGAKDRLDALGAEVEAARARIAELEQEQTETRRRPPVQAPPPPPDPRLLHRIAELEQALNGALREAGDAASARDVALERARQAEALGGRLAALESQIASGQRERADLEERLALADKRAAESARRVSDAEHRAGEAARRADESAQRLATAQRGLAEVEEVAAERERALAEREHRIAELAEGRAAAERHQEGLREEQAALEAAVAELSGLESALRERGHVIAALTRDLRESERVGKELLAELESARDEGGGDLRARLDMLATGAARAEADLTAATWRISQLERELGEARRSPASPTAVQIELEQALAAARDEVASLRRALAVQAS